MDHQSSSILAMKATLSGFTIIRLACVFVAFIWYKVLYFAEHHGVMDAFESVVKQDLGRSLSNLNFLLTWVTLDHSVP